MARPYRDARDKYFWKPTSINSIPEVIDELKNLVSKLNLTDVRLLADTPEEQRTASQQTLFAAMVVYFTDLLEREKLAGFEKALAPAMERLGPMVLRDAKKREAAQAAQGRAAEAEEKKAEGFSRPKKKKGGGPNGENHPRKKRSSE